MQKDNMDWLTLPAVLRFWYPEGAPLVGLYFLISSTSGSQAAMGGLAFGTAGILIADLRGLSAKCILKQELLNLDAMLTLFFMFTLRLFWDYLYTQLQIENKISIHMCLAAAVLLIYYVSVDPVMNVMSRYQIPVLILLTYASLPVVTAIANKFKEQKIPIVGLAVTFMFINLMNGFGASYYSNTTGHSMDNLIRI
jgi:hypothetical protein